SETASSANAPPANWSNPPTTSDEIGVRPSTNPRSIGWAWKSWMYAPRYVPRSRPLPRGRTIASTHQTASPSAKTTAAAHRSSASAVARRPSRDKASPTGRTRQGYLGRPSEAGILSRVPPEISVILPCLNEEAAVGGVVDRAWEGIERSGRCGEVIVV